MSRFNLSGMTFAELSELIRAAQRELRFRDSRDEPPKRNTDYDSQQPVVVDI